MPGEVFDEAKAGTFTPLVKVAGAFGLVERKVRGSADASLPLAQRKQT
jgi:hypothetical protein